MYRAPYGGILTPAYGQAMERLLASFKGMGRKVAADWQQAFPKEGNPRQSWILNFTLLIPNSRHWIPFALSIELGFRILIVSRNLDSLS